MLSMEAEPLTIITKRSILDVAAALALGRSLRIILHDYQSSFPEADLGLLQHPRWSAL